MFHGNFSNSLQNDKSETIVANPCWADRLELCTTRSALAPRDFCLPAIVRRVYSSAGVCKRLQLGRLVATNGDVWLRPIWWYLLCDCSGYSMPLLAANHNDSMPLLAANHNDRLL